MTKKVSFEPSILIFQIFEKWIKIAYLNDVLAVKLKNVMRLFKGISNYCVYLSRDDWDFVLLFIFHAFSILDLKYNEK